MDCSYVKYIGVVPKDVTGVADSSEYVDGIIKFSNEIVTLLSLRKFLGFEGFSQKIDEFVEMLEQRKKEHIVWVNTLKRCIESGEPFELSADPHKCKFGMWYDSYKAPNCSIKFLLQRIDMPHKGLHSMAKGINSLIGSNKPEHKERLKEIITTLDEVYVPEIVKTIEKTEEAYCNTLKEMFISIRDKSVSAAFTVDEIIGVEKLDIVYHGNIDDTMNFPEFIEGTARDKDDSLILIIDVYKILKEAENINTTPKKAFFPETNENLSEDNIDEDNNEVSEENDDISEK